MASARHTMSDGHTHTLSHKARKIHTKSRNGCAACKLRKIKCDERRPSCTNCTRFELGCEFNRTPSSVTRPIVPTNSRSLDASLHTGRRGKGRPRKDWTAVIRSVTSSTVEDGEDSTREDVPDRHTEPLPPSPPRTSHQNHVPDIDVYQAELLLHFVSCTGPRLAGPCFTKSSHVDDPVNRFWSTTVPKVGVTHPYVLHFVLALAARHLIKIGDQNTTRNRQLTSLAEEYVVRGLSEMMTSLANLDDENARPLYIASMLVRYCSFAAGPKDQKDLLAFSLDDELTTSGMPVIRGLHLIMEKVSPSKLMTGLLEPLGKAKRDREQDTSRVIPLCAEQDFPRLDWIEPLQSLRRLNEECEAVNDEGGVRLSSLMLLEAIFECIYGKEDGSVGVTRENRFVFKWLYHLNDDLFIKAWPYLDDDETRSGTRSTHAGS